MALTRKNLYAKLSQMRDAHRDSDPHRTRFFVLDGVLAAATVNQIARQRLEQIDQTADFLSDPEAEDRLRANMLEIQMEASLAGHD